MSQFVNEFAGDDSHDLDEIEFTGMWCSPSHALMWQVQLYCTMVDCPVDAEATITISAPSIFEREMVDELLVETVEKDEDELDDQDDEDNITVIVMFPDPDRDDEDDNSVDYPSTDDEDDDADDDADDETHFDDEEFYEDVVTDADVDPWAHLSPLVRYDLEQFVEDEFYDAYEFEPTITL